MRIVNIILLFITIFFSGIAFSDEEIRSIEELRIQARDLFFKHDKHKDAFQIANEAYILSKNKFTEDHPSTASIINDIAFMHYHRGEYKTAKDKFKKAYSIFDYLYKKENKKFFHKNIYSLSRLEVMHNIASTHHRQGHYSEAKQKYNEVIDLREKLEEKIISELDQKIYNGKNLHIIIYKLYGLKINILRSKNALADIYREYKNYEKAEKIYDSIFEKLEFIIKYDEQYNLAGYSIQNLAILYQEQEKYEKAEKTLKELLSKIMGFLKNDHTVVLQIEDTLANLYSFKGDYKIAEKLLLNSLKNREKNPNLGKNHLKTLHTVIELAYVYEKTQRYHEAEEHYQRALEGFELKFRLTPFHPKILEIKLRLATIAIKQEKYENSLEFLKSYEKLFADFLNEELNLTHITNNKRALLSKGNNFINLSLNLAWYFPNKNTTEFALSVLSRWHQVAIEEELYLRKLRSNNNDLEIKNIASNIIHKRELLNKIKNTSHDRETFQKTKNIIDEIKELDKLLSSSNNNLTSLKYSYHEVNNSIGKNDGILIMKSFYPLNLKTGEFEELHWLTIWITKNKNNKLIYKFNELVNIKSSYNLWKKAKNLDIIDRKDRYSIYKKMYNLLFKDLDKYFKNKTIFFISDSFLHTDDISYWPISNDEYWIQRQDIRRFGSIRDLSRKPSHVRGKNVIALTNIDYGKSPKNINKNPIITDTVLSSTVENTRNSMLSKIQTLDKKELPHLENSRKEVSMLEETQAFGEVNILEGSKANEFTLKNIEVPPYILHISTHTIHIENKSKQVSPLLFSALALANFHKGLHGKHDQDNEDGILFAQEISELNLEGTELVALPVCEAIQGEIDYSEGIYNLNRAFKISGAKNILTTLTKVEDHNAAYFMDKFYRKWIKNPDTPPSEILRELKLEFINSSSNTFNDPIFWSPYIIVETSL